MYAIRSYYDRDQVRIKFLRHIRGKAAGKHPQVAFFGVCLSFLHQLLHVIGRNGRPRLIDFDMPIRLIFDDHGIGAGLFINPDEIRLNAETLETIRQHLTRAATHPGHRR